MKISDRLRKPLSTSTSNMNLMQDAADYIDELEAYIEELEARATDITEQLRRCIRGETIQVRNELVIEALQEETERVLAMPKEDIREYLSRKYDH